MEARMTCAGAIRLVALAALMTVVVACGQMAAEPTLAPTRMPAATPTSAPTWTPAPTITPILSGQGPYREEPALTIDPEKTYLGVVKTRKGDITIRLLPDVAPRTVNSFVFLAREGFYNGLTFHNVRVFLIQGGDPLGNGYGDAGYAIPLEKSDTPHDTGAVGLAHPNDNPFGSSQFYIMKSRRPDLDYLYTVFGQVVEGMDVVNAIERGDVIESIEIEER
ncbi:MAG: peptidylprolyl isomerase [Anaerolineae bacterium]